MTTLEETENRLWGGYLNLWQTDWLFAVALTLTAVWLILYVLQATGLGSSWLPRRKTLAEALQKERPDENGRNYVDYGIKYRARISQIAAGRSAADTAQQVLAALYHPLPFAPAAFAKAFTLLFWLLPWICGASGKLGKVALLPDNLDWPTRMLVVLPMALTLAYQWVTHRCGERIWLVFCFWFLPLALC
ncbi:hypothetical protein [Methylomonas sp. HYX-M1]|uniref:hypothetical protein n=1 Tax=Methylomonas sp. HYX-M1 TaxID=3139307 RepID=UPI00345BEB25